MLTESKQTTFEYFVLNQEEERWNRQIKIPLGLKCRNKINIEIIKKIYKAQKIQNSAGLKVGNS